MLSFYNCKEVEGVVRRSCCFLALNFCWQDYLVADFTLHCMDSRWNSFLPIAIVMVSCSALLN